MKVRLKLYKPLSHKPEGKRFNSMKVRLKQLRGHNYIGINMFQFHEGPIKTHTALLMPLTLPRFNSMKVRLKLKSVSRNVIFNFVSIP